MRRIVVLNFPIPEIVRMFDDQWLKLWSLCDEHDNKETEWLYNCEDIKAANFVEDFTGLKLPKNCHSKFSNPRNGSNFSTKFFYRDLPSS